MFHISVVHVWGLHDEHGNVFVAQVPTLPVQSEVPEIPSGMMSAREDPTYKRFFKMLQVGVPEPAVRLKMQAEGLNPNILRFVIVLGFKYVKK